MIHNLQATLVTLSASGATVNKTETTVFCGQKSVGYREFYAATQVGLNPQYVLEFDLSEYECSFVRTGSGAEEVVHTPTEVIYKGKSYNIIRTYETTDALIEVTVGL